jgi:hypothetical protein
LEDFWMRGMQKKPKQSRKKRKSWKKKGRGKMNFGFLAFFH